MAYATGEKFIRRQALPHISCAGCGNGIIVSAMVRAFEELGLEPNDVVIVPGIGCSGTLARYQKSNYMHATHGRSIAFATGVKAANPKLTVVSFVGDGDGATIGGNHLIHAARRNIGSKVILVNNYNYGMTGGQVSATTPSKARTTTTQLGNPERAFDVCELAVAAGANFVARETAVSGVRLKNRLKECFQNNGFGLVEVMSPCTTLFGPRNEMKNPVIMLEWLKEHGVSPKKFDEIEDAAAKGYFKVGVFKNDDAPSYNESYEMMRAGQLAGQFAKGGK